LLGATGGGLTEEGGRRVTANGYRISFWGDENILELDSGGDCTVF